MKKFAVLLVALVFAGPLVTVLGVAALVTPATAACQSGSLIVANVPESLTTETLDGHSITLDSRQLTHAATIITTASRTPGVGRDGAIIALMAGLAESTLRMLANPSAYPASASYPNDGSGPDHDSLGIFQMRPVAGWGSVGELMNAEYQAQVFFGGSSGPNAGSPRGLLDVAGWQQLDPGKAAQSVEVSAFPDRYKNYEPVAESIFVALTKPTTAPVAPETSRVAFPLPTGTYTNTDSFGWRLDPYTGARKFHAGSDLAAPSGTPILAVADGVVAFAGQRGSYGGLIILAHTIDGSTVASYYAHMHPDGIHVAIGDTVAAGQHIGDVGSAGRSTGPHLHLEVHPGGADQPAVNATDWLADHGAAGIADGNVTPADCTLRKAA
ncbi:M23 family metallopeptidase [Conyzicola sp.]|uniref:M23 family metallopeptidase n=1 Tax=Conyzicola sp. TaxID=1969404 RepID=UPI00398A2C0F